MPACAGMTVVMDSARDKTPFQQAHIPITLKSGLDWA